MLNLKQNETSGSQGNEMENSERFIFQLKSIFVVNLHSCDSKQEEEERTFP